MSITIFTLRESCVASLRSDRHQIGMTDRHHRNAQPVTRLTSLPSLSKRMASDGDQQNGKPVMSPKRAHLPLFCLKFLWTRRCTPGKFQTPTPTGKSMNFMVPPQTAAIATEVGVVLVVSMRSRG